MKTIKNLQPTNKVNRKQSFGMYISSVLHQTGKRWADGLEKSTKHYNRKTWIILLAAFLLLGTAICLYIILTAIQGTEKQSFHF
jgi:hypothetical protein